MKSEFQKLNKKEGRDKSFFSLDNLSTTKEVFEKDKRLFITHMTDLKKLSGIVKDGGLSIDPRGLEGTDPDFTCSELYTYPLLKDKKKFFLKKERKNVPENDLSFAHLTAEDFYYFFYKKFPKYYQMLIDSFQEMAKHFGEFYQFSIEDYSLEATFVREFIISDKLKIAQGYVQRFKREIRDLIAPIYDELLSCFSDVDVYGYERSKSNILDFLFFPLKNTPVESPFFYKGGDIMVTLLIGLNEDFSNKSSGGFDSLGAYVIDSVDFKNQYDEAVLPLEFVKAVIIPNSMSKDLIIKEIKKLKKINPEFKVTVYSEKGDLIC